MRDIENFIYNYLLVVVLWNLLKFIMIKDLEISVHNG